MEEITVREVEPFCWFKLSNGQWKHCKTIIDIIVTLNALQEIV